MMSAVTPTADKSGRGENVRVAEADIARLV
jgi:hypothetical protein